MSGNITLVELDALLDTRLAVVSQLDPQAAVRLVSSPGYYTRKNDDFSSITGIRHEDYIAAWDGRDADILPHAIKTHVPLLLNEIMHRLEIQEENTPDSQPPELEVNIWPYHGLSDRERDMLCNAVLLHAGIQTIPRIVCIPPRDLTPRVIKQRYAGLILYNFRDWLKLHLEQFPRCICPDVGILTPALLHGPEVNVSEIVNDPDLRTELSLFSLTELACVEFFQLNYLEVKYFSIWRP